MLWAFFHETMVILCTMLNAETNETRGMSAENRNGASHSTFLSPSSSTGEEDGSVSWHYRCVILSRVLLLLRLCHE